ncbi:hypothetical protein Ddc_15940 [Ditylenchus destructor]|nr:hypothetical protein Ddc_15940 [Ditylenchus destructor]
MVTYSSRKVQRPNAGVKSSFSQNTTTLTCSNTTENGMHWLGAVPSCVQKNSHAFYWLVIIIFVSEVLIQAGLKFKSRLAGYDDESFSDSRSTEGFLLKSRDDAEQSSDNL